MANNSKITQDITIIEEVFAEKKPTNWKIFKTKHPKTGKVIQVGVIGIGVSCITFAVLGTVILGIVAMLGAGNAAATMLGAVSGAVLTVICSVTIGIKVAHKKAKMIDKKELNQKPDLLKIEEVKQKKITVVKSLNITEINSAHLSSSLQSSSISVDIKPEGVMSKM